MRKHLVLLASGLLSVLISTTSISSCARTVTPKNQDKNLNITFKVKGTMRLDNPNLTYYVLFYAPNVINESQFNPDEGPRMNAPDLTKTNIELEGRLPFIGKLPADRVSKCTDFYYITQFNSRTIVGRGKVDSDKDGNPISASIYDRNYNNAQTKPDGNNGYTIQIPVSDLNAGAGTNAKRMTVSFGVGDNIEIGGQGYVFDNWRNNTPLTIDLDKNIQDTLNDTSDPVMRQIIFPNRNITPVLPAGVFIEDVNIVSVTYNVN